MLFGQLTEGDVQSTINMKVYKYESINIERTCEFYTNGNELNVCSTNFSPKQNFQSR